MTWNGPVIFMHWVMDEGKQEVKHKTCQLFISAYQELA